MGVALLLGPVTALLLGVALLLDRWALAGFRSCWARAALLSGIAALLAGWMLMGVAFLLFGCALTGWCRSLAGRMEADRGPIPDVRRRGPAGLCCGLAGRMDPRGGRVAAARSRGAAGRCRAPVPS